jgi:hypothetical protein
MLKLITKGNLAAIEYPPGIPEPEFSLNTEGVLFIFGYSIQFGNHAISVAKRFETGLINYQVVGKYEEAKERIVGDFSDVVEGLDLENCLILMPNRITGT